jgi:predicted small secreted protein
MIGSKLPCRILLGLALLVAVTGCTNTFQGVLRDVDNLLGDVQRDVDNLLGDQQTTSDDASESSKTDAADEWVDPE